LGDGDDDANVDRVKSKPQTQSIVDDDDEDDMPPLDEPEPGASIIPEVPSGDDVPSSKQVDAEDMPPQSQSVVEDDEDDMPPLDEPEPGESVKADVPSGNDISSSVDAEDDDMPPDLGEPSIEKTEDGDDDMPPLEGEDPLVPQVRSDTSPVDGIKKPVGASTPRADAVNKLKEIIQSTKEWLAKDRIYKELDTSEYKERLRSLRTTMGPLLVKIQSRKEREARKFSSPLVNEGDQSDDDEGPTNTKWSDVPSDDENDDDMPDLDEGEGQPKQRPSGNQEDDEGDDDLPPLDDDDLPPLEAPENQGLEELD